VSTDRSYTDADEEVDGNIDHLFGREDDERRSVEYVARSRY